MDSRFHLSWGVRLRGRESHIPRFVVSLLFIFSQVSSSQPQLWRLDCPSPGSSLIGFVVTSAELTTLALLQNLSCNLFSWYIS